jgi:hypothetical protein
VAEWPWIVSLKPRSRQRLASTSKKYEQSFYAAAPIRSDGHE